MNYSTIVRLLVVIWLPVPSHSAEVNFWVDEEGLRPTIAIEGPIVDGDLKKFKQALHRMPPDVEIRLDSPGGLLEEALEIGTLVSQRELNTLVDAGATCASACALIWLAGKSISIGGEISVGFHGPYIPGESPVRSPAGNQLVRQYLLHLGFNDLVADYVLEASPQHLRWLTRSEAQYLKIPAEWKKAKDYSIPYQLPTRDEVMTELLANHVGARLAEKFPQYLDHFVDAVLDSMSSGLEASGLEFHLGNELGRSPIGTTIITTLIAETDADLLAAITQAELAILQYFESTNKYLCAMQLEMPGLTYDASVIEDKVPPQLQAGLIWYMTKAVTEPPAPRSKLTATRKRAIESWLKAKFKAHISAFSSAERKRIRKPNVKTDADLYCSFHVKWLRTLAQDQSMWVDYLRHESDITVN